MNRNSLTEFNRLMNNPEISKQVYDKHPVSKAEKRCANEKATMDQLRLSMAKKIYAQMNTTEKVEYK